MTCTTDSLQNKAGQKQNDTAEIKWCGNWKGNSDRKKVLLWQEKDWNISFFQEIRGKKKKKKRGGQDIVINSITQSSVTLMLFCHSGER